MIVGKLAEPPILIDIEDRSVTEALVHVVWGCGVELAHQETIARHSQGGNIRTTVFYRCRLEIFEKSYRRRQSHVIFWEHIDNPNACNRLGPQVGVSHASF